MYDCEKNNNAHWLIVAEMLDSNNYTDTESLTSSLTLLLTCGAGRTESVGEKKAKIQLRLFQFVCVRITSPKTVPSSSHAKANNWPCSCESWAGRTQRCLCKWGLCVNAVNQLVLSFTCCVVTHFQHTVSQPAATRSCNPTLFTFA